MDECAPLKSGHQMMAEMLLEVVMELGRRYPCKVGRCSLILSNPRQKRPKLSS
jgi:hypothetical protein